MTEYPLVFTFSDSVSGNGFLAKVTLNGRALMVHEDETWWMLGVRPSAFAASAETPAGAHIEFRKTFTAVLFDSATIAYDFEAFKAEVERFYNERDEEQERRWQAASDAMIQGLATPEPPFTSLKRESPDARPLTICVERLDQRHVFAPSENVLDTFALSAAA